MPNFNRVTLIGHLGKDPEVRNLNETTLVEFSLATTEKWTDKRTMEKHSKTQWHNVKFFGKTGEVIKQYCAKGDCIMVEGKIDYNEDEKNGVKRTFTNIVGSSFEFIKTKGEPGERPM